MLQWYGDKAMKELTEICREIYRVGVWPEDLTEIVLVPIKKKTNAVVCEDHWTISLVAHASKIVLKVLINRIEAKAKDFISNNQFGFRKGVGTRDAVGVRAASRHGQHGHPPRAPIYGRAPADPAKKIFRNIC